MKTSSKALWGATAIIASAAVAVTIMAHAQTAPTTSCSGAVTGNQIAWTATSTGGVAPYTFLWSGDGIASGTTGAAVIATYGANGTYTAMIQATDASSSVATSSCTATVSSYAVTSTSTLNVSVLVNNAAGGSAVPANFTVTVNGANASPNSFSGNASGTAVTVDASATYSIGVSSLTNYSGSMSGNCVGPIAAGAVASCAVTETYVPPTVTPTSTPPLPRARPPELVISASGRFLARGMTVTSIASGSFQGTVWGITYTINWSGSFPAFYFRNGDDSGTATNPVTQLQVGDEVGVSGVVSPSNPLVVQADVVRDYSILTLRPGKREGQSTSPYYNGIGNGGQNFSGTEDASGTSATSSGEDLNVRLQSLLNQFHNLQNMLQNREKANGNGNDNGNGHGNGQGD